MENVLLSFGESRSVRLTEVSVLRDVRLKRFDCMFTATCYTSELHRFDCIKVLASHIYLVLQCSRIYNTLFSFYKNNFVRTQAPTLPYQGRGGGIQKIYCRPLASGKRAQKQSKTEKLLFFDIK